MILPFIFRFSRIHKPSSRRPNRGGPSAMDIDSVGHNGGNNSGRGRGGRVGRGQRRGGSRGGGRGSTRGSGRRGNARKPLTQDALDNDLDNYMMKDPEVAKARLDQEMDAYQQARQ